MDFVDCNPLAQPSAVLVADSPHSSQNRENSAPSTTGKNMSMAACKISTGHVTNVAGDLHSVDQAGLSTDRSSLRYQGTDYTILDKAPSEQTFREALSLILSLILRPSSLLCLAGSASLLH